MNLEKLTSSVVALARQAGEQVLRVYHERGQTRIEYKSDHSPVTEADKAADEVIRKGLRSFSELPILSEEAEVPPWAERRTWDDYWLVDPLDGTKEFINKSGEFTVNIALVSNGRPVLGIVFAPALDVLYHGARGYGAFKLTSGNEVASRIGVADLPGQSRPWTIMGSRSHQTRESREFIAYFREANVIHWGSSLKLCLVAEGAADLYPRLGPTCEWDTAAGQAVVEAAGGRVIDLNSRADLLYNTRQSLLNPYFVACAVESDWIDAASIKSALDKVALS